MIVAKIILLMIGTFSAVMSLFAAQITLDPDMDAATCSRTSSPASRSAYSS